VARKPELARRVVAIADASDGTGVLETPRHFTEVDGMVGTGAEQVAKLTLAARSQDWLLPQVMEALELLSNMTAEQWTSYFLIATPLEDQFGKPYFNWRHSPVKRYADFQAFYREELEQAFGRWSDLQALWKRRVAGEISDDQARQEIKNNAAAIMAAAPAEVGPGQGARTDLKPRSDTTKLGRNVDYLAARIKRDHPNIAAAVERGEYKSMRAAAIAAGIITPPTPLDLLRRAWARSSPEEQAVFRAEIDPASSG